jgi:hypothetical protein
VEFVVMGQCDIGASTGGTTTLRPALGATGWYGVRFLDSSDSTAISDLINVDFTGTVFTVTADSLTLIRQSQAAFRSPPSRFS